MVKLIKFSHNHNNNNNNRQPKKNTVFFWLSRPSSFTLNSSLQSMYDPFKAVAELSKIGNL